VVKYLRDVLGIQFLQQAPQIERAMNDSSQEDLTIHSGDWIWIGAELEQVPIFSKVVQAVYDHLKENKFQGQVLHINLAYSEVLELDFPWPDNLTVVCHDEDFYNIFSQVLPDSAKLILIPDPKKYESEPQLKKVAWQALTKDKK